MIEEKGVLGLIAIRRNRGVSLEQIADATKISTRFLEAIEKGDFRRLPGGIYNTSYIRQYAKAIEYDEATLLAFYQGEMARTDGSVEDSDKRKGTYGGSIRNASTIFGS